MTDWKFRCLDDSECSEAYWQALEEGLMPFYFPQLGNGITQEFWMSFASHPETLPLGFFFEGKLAGLSMCFPAAIMSRVLEVNPLMFREHFSLGAKAFREASLWALKNLDCSALLGKTPSVNRHILRLLPEIGYNIKGTIPDFFWYERKQKYVDAVLSVATKETIQGKGE